MGGSKVSFKNMRCQQQEPCHCCWLIGELFCLGIFKRTFCAVSSLLELNWSVLL